MDKNTINKITSELKERYPDAGIRSIEVNENNGTSTFFLDPTQKSLAFLDNPIIPHAYRSQANITRDFLSRPYLDLGIKRDSYDEDPQKLYEKALRYYYTDPLVGSVINMLSSLSCKGFENDIDDPEIKNFYDTWAFDVDFEEVLEWIFLDLFRTSNVVTYKYVAKYEPRISTILPVGGKTPKTSKAKITGDLETAASSAKKALSKGQLPVGYTVLNPSLVKITGNLLFNQVSASLRPPPELAELLKKASSDLTQEEKDFIKSMPKDLKNAATGGGDFLLDSELVGIVTYKKQPYERYARPRIARVFDALNYKSALQQADLSTLDGISNYILKITIGNDEYPVVAQDELEAVAKLFDTPSKSFDVVWNHTLQVEKIVSPEIEAILGKNKYLQVNDDITAGLSFCRALLDGTGEGNAANVEWAMRGIREDIDYARRQVTKWIYKEYRQIAEAMGFDRFPRVRWDDGILKDDILYKNVIASMVDRRMLSYETALETLGFDYQNELEAMQAELPLVEEGIFGIIGSPFQRSAVQDTQRAPSGTPSNGRPTGKPTTKKKKSNDPSKTTSSVVLNLVKDLSHEEIASLIEEINNIDIN